MRTMITSHKLPNSFCWLIFSLGILTAPAPAQTTAQAPVKARLTEAQAIQLAQQFCQRIGQPVTGPAVTEFPEREELVDLPNHFWQTCWKISFGYDVDVQVIDATGVIRGYGNNAFFHKPLAEQHLPVGEFISEQEAMQKALFILQATGQTEELTPPDIRFEEIARPVKHGTTDWAVRWHRSSHGIAYREDGADVILDGESGKVISAGIGYYSPPLAAFTERFHRAETAAIAGEVMSQVGLPDAVPETRIVRAGLERMERPNTFWQDGDENHPAPGPARPVHAHVYRADNIYYEVWIDMETGQTIGGSWYSLRGGANKPSIKHFLSRSKMTALKAK